MLQVLQPSDFRAEQQCKDSLQYGSLGRATSAAVSEAAATAVVGGTLYFRDGLASAQQIP